MSDARNVPGGLLQVCGVLPMTGFVRDGVCHTGPQDIGNRTVCVQMTEAFLDYSLLHGNDLISPAPEYDFSCLQPGDRRCMCAARWPGPAGPMAAEDGTAPPVVLDATHARTLQHIALGDLQYHALRTPDCPGQDFTLR